jgi:penicillin-insensitive murein endopeptidase
MKIGSFLFIVFCFSFCSSGQHRIDPIRKYYNKHAVDTLTSISHGSVSDGSMEHGKLIPYYGSNYSYFDTTSYFSGRAFLHEDVLGITLKAYKELENASDRFYRIMECANKNGGKLFPHQTHQNGTSIDFMMPLIKDHKPYYKLDETGVNHYWLTFDDTGKYSEDKSVEIDFEAVAQHILILNDAANKRGWKVKKVIIKIELKDELYATPSGKKLKAKGIYVVQGLSKMVNALHDEHFHIDFAKV